MRPCLKKQTKCLIWWHRPLIPAHRRQGQEKHLVKINLVYTASSRIARITQRNLSQKNRQKKPMHTKSTAGVCLGRARPRLADSGMDRMNGLEHGAPHGKPQVQAGVYCPPLGRPGASWTHRPFKLLPMGTLWLTGTDRQKEVSPFTCLCLSPAQLIPALLKKGAMSLKSHSLHPGLTPNSLESTRQEPQLQHCPWSPT